MDGYALRLSDLEQSRKIRVAGESAAGAPYRDTIPTGACVRIFTGAEVPADADCIIVKEQTIEADGFVLVQEGQSIQGQHIRLRGSQIRKGCIALAAGTAITPAAAGFLASLGMTDVMAGRLPRIALLVTGSELVKAGDVPAEGQIFESNSIMLEAAAQTVRCGISVTTHCPDDEKGIAASVRSLLAACDVLLVSGGISVGKYDYTGKVLAGEGVQQQFYKVSQKPGKPLFFGTAGPKIVFGLPGNPAAALTCFYEYVFPALQQMQGYKNPSGLRRITLPLGAEWKKKPGLVNFLKGRIENGLVFPLEGQESYMLHSFSSADCLIYVPAEASQLAEGTFVQADLLPG